MAETALQVHFGSQGGNPRIEYLTSASHPIADTRAEIAHRQLCKSHKFRRSNSGGTPIQREDHPRLALPFALLRRSELLDQRPPDFLLVLDERFSFRWRHVPERHAQFRKTLLHARRIERLTKSVAQTPDDRFRCSRRSGEAHESDGSNAW